ncbi:MAG TPA: DUF2905 domain-containing protein [Candidatus Dormibacteraeota bacterium]
MPLTDPGKLLLIVGVVIAVIGGVIIVARRLGLGHLPGDVTVSSGGVSLFVPIVACVVVSIVLTVVINVLLRLR